MGTLNGQIGHLTSDRGFAHPLFEGFLYGLYDQGILGRFLEISSLEILRNRLEIQLARERATNRGLFFKSEKARNFFLKKNFNN